jgi:uncharacterized protein YndB with AHSA1/START domain
MTRSIVHAIEIHSEPKSVYDMVATKSGLASFWTPDVGGDDAEGGELKFGFREAPAPLPIQVTRLKPPREVVWTCPGGFPFWEGTGVRWSIEASEHGSKVVFRHAGFPDAQPEFDFGSISLTWALIVARLKDVVEAGGAANPALI